MARQCDGKDRALHPRGAASIRNLQCPMMFGHNAAGNEETQTTPAAVGTLLAADKWLENPLHVSLRDASAIVANFNRGAVLVSADAHLDSAVLYGVFHGVVYEVTYRLNDSVRVRVENDGGVGVFVDEAPLA